MKDFSNSRGLLVKYSGHYHKEHGRPRKVVLGVVTEVQTYLENGALVYYPTIVWEGGTTSTCHPMNVTPYRKGVNLPDLPLNKG